MPNTVVPANSVASKLRHAGLVSIVRHSIYTKMESVKDTVTSGLFQPSHSYRGIHHASQAKKRRRNRGH